MAALLRASRKGIIALYNKVVGGIEEEAASDIERAYGGFVRAEKGKLVEAIAKSVVQIAWAEAKGAADRLSFDEQRRYEIPIRQNYLKRLPSSVRAHIGKRRNAYTYNAQVDVHVFVDGELIMGVECKAYAENAMLKRILVDYTLLTSMHADLVCTLFQLESQLGGDYSSLSAQETMGSPSTHTLMSYFPGVDLHIVTLLEGDRDVSRPIHKTEHFKKLKPANLDHAIARYADLLRPFV